MKVLLYHDWPLAKDYLDPIASVIKRSHPEWEVFEAGFHKPYEERVYDWVVSCDELSVAPLGRRNLCVFHGMASKGQAFSTARRSAFVDTDTIFAVPGPRYAKTLLDMGVSEDRVHVTGLTKLDGFKRNILYAPTHNPKLSAIPVIQDRIYELDNVKVQLHMWTTIGEKEHHTRWRRYYADGTVESTEDNLRWADVVIGDFGSIIVEAIALGKQTFQVINPKWEQHYLDKGLARAEIIDLPEVWYPARYSTPVHSFDDLHDALTVMPLGDSASKIVKIMQETRI